MEVHSICGSKTPIAMSGKPMECVNMERSILHKAGDVCIVTYPKTGTTLIQYICHLIRTHAQGTEFEDIHQVCPHTSSAWFIGQDLNDDQVAIPRLFKSHRDLSQVAPFSIGVKYICTIRDPIDTLVSMWQYRTARGLCNTSLREFAQSSKWTSSTEGSTLYDHFRTFWSCLQAGDLLIIPYEDLVSDRMKWLPLIAAFMSVSTTNDELEQICALTSKEQMLVNISKFDESWCERRRLELDRPHPTILREAPKVTLGHIVTAQQARSDDVILNINNTLWSEKVTTTTQVSSYAEMRILVNEHYFPSQHNNAVLP